MDLACGHFANRLELLPGVVQTGHLCCNADARLALASESSQGKCAHTPAPLVVTSMPFKALAAACPERDGVTGSKAYRNQWSGFQLDLHSRATSVEGHAGVGV